MASTRIVALRSSNSYRDLEPRHGKPTQTNKDYEGPDYEGPDYEGPDYEGPDYEGPSGTIRGLLGAVGRH